MDLVLLGGPLFLGRHVIDAALDRGHRVSMCNRGQTNPHLYPDVERLVGDRRGDMGAISGRQWDAVIDTSAYLPADVSRATDALAGGAGHYVFVSTVSVYADMSAPVDEDAPVATIADAEAEEFTMERYGPLKARCEQEAEAAMPGRVANVRPGLIVGPHDPTDRFTYWVRRVAAGGEVLVPDRGDMPVQVIDVRDLAQWLVRVAEQRTSGVFNATGPPQPFNAVLDACAGAAGDEPSFTRVDETFLLERKVQPWVELPLWIPEVADMAGMGAVNTARAVSAGLSCRPLADTCRATLAWDRTRDGVGMDAQLSREREAELIAAWKDR